MRSPVRVVEHESRALFGNHHRWSIGVARRDGRHDRCVDDAKAVDAVNLEAVADYGQRVAAHPAGAHGMEDRRAQMAGGA